MKKINIDNWKEFRVGDLFEVETSKSINSKLSLDFDENNEYEFIGRTAINNGIQGKISKQDFNPNPSNVFSIAQIGDNVCQFRESEWYASQNIFILTPKFKELINVNKFITCILTKKMRCIFGDAYSSFPTLKTLPQLIIKLPATPDGEPDWKYMEDYMEKTINKAQENFNGFKKIEF